MRFGRLVRSAAVLVAAPIAVTGLVAAPAQAHGTLGDPISRVAACYAEGPESPRSQMCVRLVEENGTAITGLFVTAIALMAAGAGALHLARKRRGVV